MFTLSNDSDRQHLPGQGGGNELLCAYEFKFYFDVKIK